MSAMPELIVVSGPLKDCIFTVSDAGLRLGRSSSCEISIPDPSLSRNHCLFEVRDGVLWLTDLASANGTCVNGVLLGAESRKLVSGDLIVAGESELSVRGQDEPVPSSTVREEPGAPQIDLGFHQDDEQPGAERGTFRRIALWAVAGVAVVLSVLLILSEETGDAAPATQPVAEEKAELCSFSFEKVEADANGIYRYALAYEKGGTMDVEIDDIPRENRHVRKSAQLSSAACETLERLFASSELYRLDAEYTGAPSQPGTLKSFTLRVIRGKKVFSIAIENALEPDAFRIVRERLEAFSKNELGIWAIQYSAEKLVEMSAEARRTGDAKWEEREVQHGNLSAALAAYNEAVFYLDTVNPKPTDFGALVKRRQEVEAELDRRYRDQRFLADRAINLADWNTALRELRVLCDLVPDAKDPRHAEAAAKLLDVEARLKKGARK